MKYALIQSIGDGDEIVVIGLANDPIELMDRARKDAREMAKDFTDDMRRDPHMANCPEPEIVERLYTNHFEFTVSLPSLGCEWIVNATQLPQV